MEEERKKVEKVMQQRVRREIQFFVEDIQFLMTKPAVSSALGPVWLAPSFSFLLSNRE